MPKAGLSFGTTSGFHHNKDQKFMFNIVSAIWKAKAFRYM